MARGLEAALPRVGFVLVTTERFVSAALLQLSLHDKHKAHCCNIDVDLASDRRAAGIILARNPYVLQY